MRQWDDLRVFLAVAHAGRIAGAARVLGVDATTVGRRLARLERETGAALFVTIAGERRLTEAGSAMLASAETIDAAVAAAVAGTAIHAAGHVRLSVAEGLATHVLAPALGTFRTRHPHVRLDLITASGVLDPSKREADIAVMLARPRNRLLRAEPLTRYGLGLYASDGYLAEQGAPVVPHDLTRHTLVGYVPEHLHAPELDYLSEMHDGLGAALRSTSINVQQAMISAGAGVGILPVFVAARDARLRRVLPDLMLERTFWLVVHAEGHPTPRIAATIAWLREATARLGTW